MIKYLIKTVTEIRVESEEDANAFHKEIEAFAHEKNYTLSSWTQTLKERKSKGEVIESWVICKYILVFNDPKEPEIMLSDINYEMEGELPWK